MTHYQQLLNAVHDLINEINESDYVDMVGSDIRINRVKELIGWPSKVWMFRDASMDLVNRKDSKQTESDPFAPALYTGSGNAEINKRNQETMTALPPVGCYVDTTIQQLNAERKAMLNEEVFKRVMEKAMIEITNGSNTFSLTANKVWYALAEALESELGKAHQDKWEASYNAVCDERDAIAQDNDKAHALLRQALSALESALSDDQPYISQSKEVAEAIKEFLE